MTLDHAIEILGINRTLNNDLRPMVKALSLHAWLNTAEETERRAAAAFVILHWQAYQVECNKRRDRRVHRRGK